jgi:spore maturation protein CgeB
MNEMKILYVAKHGNGDNDDEGAIAYALTKLGHKVTCVHEQHAHKISDEGAYDFALFHKFENLPIIQRWSPDTPRCFWYFDLVTHNDWDLKLRSASRVQWMRAAEKVFHVGFMTDGDWAKQSDKWVHLPQGADERVVAYGDAGHGPLYNILFTGTTIHGGKRLEHIRELQHRYKQQFTIIGDRNKKRYHGRELADITARTRVMVAPDAPVTDLYWSNRVYQCLGFGGFLLHPYCEGLTKHFEHGKEIIFYRDRKELVDLIDHYNTDDRDIAEERLVCGLTGLDRVRREHLYQHRCETLVTEMQQRFNI